MYKYPHILLLAHRYSYYWFPKQYNTHANRSTYPYKQKYQSILVAVLQHDDASQLRCTQCAYYLLRQPGLLAGLFNKQDGNVVHY